MEAWFKWFMLMVYGATGFTGELIVRELARIATPVVVAGRDRAGLDRLALPGERRAFGWDDPHGLRAGLAGIRVVVNAVGGAADRATALIAECIARGIHYLDLAGEVAEHEALRALGATARARGAMLLPGVGFGVVPTHLAAIEAARRLGAPPDRLVIAYDVAGDASRGTLETVLGQIHTAGVQRERGALVAARAGRAPQRLALGPGRRTLVVTNPWRADLVSTFVALGTPEITTLASFPAAARLLMAWPRFTRSWLGRRLVRRTIAAAPRGPSAAARAAGTTHVLARATTGARTVTVRLRGPDAYDFTARAAAAVATRVLAGTATPGFATPSDVLAWSDLLGLDGVAELA